MIFNKRTFSLALCLSLSGCLIPLTYAQNAKEIFGKNKVQFSDDHNDWWQHETNNFISYYYGKSKDPAKFCIEIAESENAEIQKLFEYHLKDKIELIIYTDPSDHAQTNIALDDQFPEKTWKDAPKIKGQKILLFYTGNHAELRKLLRAGIIKIYFASLFDGTAIQDAVQKVISLRLPDWFEAGLIEYLTVGWTNEAEMAFYNQWKSKSFRKYASRYPVSAGNSFWAYLLSRFGQQSISNWLYFTRIQKDIEEAARIAFSSDLSSIETDWFRYYKEKAPGNSARLQDLAKLPLLKTKAEEIILSMNPSTFRPKQYLLTTQQHGRSRVRLFNPATGKTKTLFKKGSSSKLFPPDLNYPIVCESPTGKDLYIFYEKRNRIYLIHMDALGKKFNQKLPESIQRIYSAAYFSKDQIIMTASTGGPSDLFLYNIKGRNFTQLTDDRWDDLNILELPGAFEKNYLLLSNRPHGEPEHQKDSTYEMPLGSMKIYSCIISTDGKSFSLKTFLGDSSLNITKLQTYKGNVLFEGESNRQKKWYTSTGDSFLEFAMDQHPAVMSHSHDANENLCLYRIKDQYRFQRAKLTTVSFSTPVVLDSVSEATKDSARIAALSDSTFSESLSFFQSIYPNPSNIQSLLNEFNTKKQTYTSKSFERNRHLVFSEKPTIQKYLSYQSIAYRPKYYFDELSTRLDNELLFSGLQTYTGAASSYEVPEIGILFKTRIVEVLENFIGEAGIRIPTTFNGLEAYALFDHRLFLCDQTYAFYFKTQTDVVSNLRNASLKKQSNTWLLNYQLKYPIDHYKSLRAIATLRNDRIQYLSTTQASLFDSVASLQQRIGVRLEYVFDNALDLSLNLKNGWQAKCYFEFSKPLQINLTDQFRFLDGSLLVAGFDIRHHLPVLKKSTLSQRAYSNISFGSHRILYYVGGTENWLIPKFEDQNPLATTGEYRYNALATEVRGHAYGARKGGSVFGYSLEFRIPILQYLIQQNWKNSLFRNFQFLLFYDASVVWDGFYPNITKSSTVNYFAQNPVVQINLQYYRDPWIAGTGFGFRTSLFGYYLRIDHAWPIQDFKLETPKWLFSLGLDF